MNLDKLRFNRHRHHAATTLLYGWQ